MNSSKFDFKKYWPLIAGAVLVVVAGVGLAYLLSTRVMGRVGSAAAAPGAKVTANSAGVLDPKIKYDNATGVLKDGGIDNEGTKHLESDAGPSHYVYLTSSVVDLQAFVGKKVEVWGETLASKHAPWLMDVAKIQVVQ